MKKNISILLVALLFNCLSLSAANFTKTYHDEPMPNVLRDIDNAYSEGNISFIFNELEDFTVTVSIKNKTIMEAIYEAVGFYPIRVTKSENNIYLECWQKEANKLKGRLLDENLNPVEFANVHLFNPADTTFISGGVTNQNGDFVIPVDAKEVLLKTNCIGYMPYSSVHKVGSVGTIRIYTNAKILKEVTVEQRHVDYNGDKITAYPTSTQIKHSYDMFSLLNQQPFPGMFVDQFNRTISVFNGSPIILIDGVKRTVQDLYSIQPKNIKKIEYSMNVPMKYADSGASGVIYIYLKDPKSAGGSFYANIVGSVNTGFVDADMGTTYNQGKSQFVLDYIYNLRDYNERIVNRNESYIGDDFNVNFKEEGSESPMYYNQHRINFGYNYRHDKSLLFSAKLRNSLFDSHKEEMGLVEDSYSGNYNRLTSIKNYSYTPSLDLYMRKEWNDGHTLEVQVVGSLSDDDYERTYDDEYDNGETKSYPSKVDTDYKSLISEVTYQKTLGSKTSLSTGFQNRLSKSENDYVLNDYTTSLDQNNNYAYMNLSQRIGKMSLNIGTGVKYIKMKSENNEREFTHNITSFNLSGSPRKSLYISLAGSYNPVTPGLSQLTDLVQVSNDYLSINGNPNLKPSHSLNTRMSIATDIKKKLGIILVNTLNYTIDPMYTTVEYMGNKKFLRYSDNYDNWLRYEARLVLTLNEVLNKHLTARLETYYNHYKTQGEDWSHSLNSMGMSLNVTAYLNKWTVQMYYRMPYKTLGANTISKTEPWNYVMVGYRHKNWFFGGSWYFPLQSKGTEYPQWYLSKTYKGYGCATIKDNANMVSFNVRYNVAFGKLFGKTKRTLNNTASSADVMTL